MPPQTDTVPQNSSSFNPFLINHSNSYRSVLEKGFDSLPQGGYVQSLQLIMIKVHKSCLALVGQLKLHHGGAQEGSPIFTNSIEILVSSSGTRCQVIPDCFSQAKNLKSPFYGSHYFAASKITYYDVVQPSAADFPKALADPSALYVHENFTLQRIPDQWVPFNQKDSDKIKAFENARFLSERAMLDGIQLLSEAISGFLKLNLRTWLSFDDRRYQLKKHIYWPTEREGEPFYRNNNTHISLA